MGNENSPKLRELNADVLHEVFTYLPLRDRKNARLVCQKWLQVCSRRVFSETEAFFIPCWYALPVAVKALQRVRSETLNLKFHLHRIDQVFDVLWETCGTRITALQFRRCELDSEIVAKIFNSCPNLSEFSVFEEYASSNDHKCFVEKHSESATTAVAAVADKLSTLRLEYPLDDDDLLNITSYFPNLKNLDMYLRLSEPEDARMRESEDFRLSDAEDRTVPTKTTFFYYALELLRSRLPRLENLRLTLLELDGVSEFECDWSALKSMSLTIHPTSLRPEYLPQTFFNYKFWTKLHILDVEPLSDDQGSRSPSTAMLARLLDENPQLEEFAFALQPRNISELSVVFAALVKSNLKTLTINAYDFIYPDAGDNAVTLDGCIREAEMCSLPLTRNHSVRRLKIEASGNQLCSLFLKYFRNIRSLHAVPGNVADIFAFQTKLRALTLGQFRETGGYEYTPPRAAAAATAVQPVQTIRTLEFFQIRLHGLQLMFGYAFPRLKYFVYDKECLDEKPDADGAIVNEVDALMSHLLRHSPRLQGVSLFSCNRVRMHAFVAFFERCLHFRQLRYIALPCWATNVENGELKGAIGEYLSRSSSLRAVWIDVLSGFKVYAFLNVDNGKFEFSEPYYFPHRHFSKTLYECWRNER